MSPEMCTCAQNMILFYTEKQPTNCTELQLIICADQSIKQGTSMLVYTNKTISPILMQNSLQNAAPKHTGETNSQDIKKLN